MQAHRPSRLRRDPDVVARRLGDEMVLVNLRTNRILRLNRTGARLWELLDGGGDVDELGERLGAEYDVDRRELEKDLASGLERLEALGLVTRDGP
jgi:hypothetical protein